ncbi:PRTRC system ThiF family protein [Mucilaginibacter ginkgonis]|uniref:PRTRC system ThiF family protein n=1 Tax=Mucilaginibacter ginkgonis TaxID=2682091 RepID=A0A6I4HZJ6_9SPHI|nr:PRTRC system ThiF family protein [Mucilaginibacter ginkgonis]QQL50003.1 PRTRC system ThiF family protein [Mucilaginibacter ginkgonis]
MKNQNARTTKPAAHIIPKELLQPYNPVTVNLIGAGGTGGQVLTALARMNHSLIALGHAGLFVRIFDDDTVSPANLGRQLFTTSETGQFKSVALINRINRFFGTNWKAETYQYSRKTTIEYSLTSATIIISCVDTVQARFEIAQVLSQSAKNHYSRDRGMYWMDFGNSRNNGQVILSTLGKIPQPVSERFRTVDTLPLITNEFNDLMEGADQNNEVPSCSLAEALTKQDLYINSALANCGASLLWQLFREGILFNRGLFLNLQDFRAQPMRIA